jgi:5-methylcytosine-specific restriction endonuclease McrA
VPTSFAMKLRALYGWVAIQAYIDDGNGYVKCHKHFGIAHATWVKAIGAGLIRVDTQGRPYADARKRFDWVATQGFYNSGASVRDCIARFGCSNQTWQKAMRRGQIITRPRKSWTAAEALAQSKSRITIKRHLLRAGILENRCDWCGLTTWRGQPISIQIDHVNGIRDDHRLENLRMLCPNCHSQTDTFAAKNRKSNGSPSSSNGRTASSDVAYGGSSPSLGA